MLKKEIRAVFKSKRGSISSKIHEDLSVEIANQCLKLDIWNFTNYHIFLPIKKNKEINTKHIIQIIQGRDKNVILPKIESDFYIKNYLLTDSTLLITNSLGISEPQNGLQVNVSELDFVIVPVRTRQSIVPLVAALKMPASSMVPVPSPASNDAT